MHFNMNMSAIIRFICNQFYFIQSKFIRYVDCHNKKFIKLITNAQVQEKDGAEKPCGRAMGQIARPVKIKGNVNVWNFRKFSLLLCILCNKPMHFCYSIRIEICNLASDVNFDILQKKIFYILFYINSDNYRHIKNMGRKIVSSRKRLLYAISYSAIRLCPQQSKSLQILSGRCMCFYVFSCR